MGEGSSSRGFGSSASGPGGVLPAPTAFGNILIPDTVGPTTWIANGAPGTNAADAGKIWYWNPTTKLWTLTAAPTGSGNFFQWDDTTKTLVPAASPTATGDIIFWDNATRRWTKLAVGSVGQYLVSVTGPTVGWRDGGPMIHFACASVGNNLDRWMSDSFAQNAGTLDIRRHIAVRDGTLKRLFVQQQTTGTADATNTYTVQIDGVDTAIVVAVSNGSSAVVSDIVNSAAVTAGQGIGLKLTKSASPAGQASDVTACLMMAPAT